MHIGTVSFEVKIHRDSELCGPDRERQWKKLYALNLSLLGRSTICKSCPNQRRCAWYSNRTNVCRRLVLQTQDRLFKNLDAIAASDLTILDELKFLDFDLQKRASRKSLEKFAKLLRDYDALTDLLMVADAILTNGPRQPTVLQTNTASIDVERRRNELFSFQYKLLNAEIYNFLPLVENQRNLEIYHRDSAIFYNDRPEIPGGLFVAGYGANQGLLEHYFGRPFVDLTPSSKYIHPGSRFYQLASSSTSHSKFMKNHRSRAGIYRFAAAQIASNQTIGKKTLLIAKSDATALILNELPKYFSRITQTRVAAYNKDNQNIFDGTSVIPLLHYGVEGINAFEDYDCVICLMAYNLPVEVVANQLRKLGAGRDIVVEIVNKPSGLGREVVTDPKIPYASAVFDYLERHKVLQTVCRARPFTTPTEVFFAGRQEFEGAIVFRDVREMARSLDLNSGVQKLARCEALKNTGLTQAEIAKEMNCSERTISRFIQEIRKRGGRTNEETQTR
jgi:hypothetical protein